MYGFNTAPSIFWGKIRFASKPAEIPNIIRKRAKPTRANLSFIKIPVSTNKLCEKPIIIPRMVTCRKVRSNAGMVAIP